MSEGHIFVHDPKNSHNVCWICGMKKDEHPLIVQHKTVGLDHTKLPSKQKVSATRKRQKVNIQG